MSSIDDDKRMLRKHYISARKDFDNVQRTIKDMAIAENIDKLLGMIDVCGVVGYDSDGSEPDLFEVMEDVRKQGRQIAAPRYNSAAETYEPVLVGNWDEDFVEARYGLMEPKMELPTAPVSANWVWLVPAVAFDGQGRRLGRGGGYYDRMLSKYPGKRIGVCYQCQFSSSDLPGTEHDQKLDWVVTEEKVYNF